MAMRLSRVEISNFGPYRGTTEVKLDTQRPIIVIHGENMRGKTSFLNAVRWCLYGIVLDRLEIEMPVRRLVNQHVMSESDWTMNVTLDFTVDSDTYQLKRQVQPKSGKSTPNTFDHESLVFMWKNGKHLTEEDARAEIEQILPNNISQFFLFDGEMLNRFEALMADRTKQSSTVKDAIEAILGVPALQHAIADVQTNRKEATRRQNNLARQKSTSEVYAQRASELDQDVEALEEEISDLRQELAARQHSLDELDAHLQATAGIQADAQRLQDLRSRIEALKIKETELNGRRRDKLALAWQDVLSVAVEPRLSEFEAEREHLQGVAQEALALRTDLERIDSMLADHACPTCRQGLPADRMTDLASNKSTLEEQLHTLSVDDEALGRATDSIRRLRRIRPAGVLDSVREIEREIRQAIVDRSDADYQKDELEERLSVSEAESVSRNRIAYREIMREFADIQRDIDDATAKAEEKRKAADSNRAQIKSFGDPALARAGREVALYDGLGGLLKRSLERLQQDLREAVQADASEIFHDLTTDKSYQGLTINSWYGLQIRDEHGNPVEVRSAGAEQVVALSLIGALNRNAVRRGPVIMDTPFGRLDPRHRENILKLLPSLAQQVILLVHSGEVDVERDLARVRDQIGAEFQIEYVRSGESQIRRREV